MRLLSDCMFYDIYNVSNMRLVYHEYLCDGLAGGASS